MAAPAFDDLVKNVRRDDGAKMSHPELYKAWCLSSDANIPFDIPFIELGYQSYPLGRLPFIKTFDFRSDP